MQQGKFNVIVDSAWGSSGKGAASTRLADIYDIPNLSSCNFANAGHTVVYNGKSIAGNIVFKVLPSGAALYPFKGRHPRLWIGPNSGFFPEQLNQECAVTGYKPGNDLFIHERAVVMTEAHKAAEAPDGAQSTLHISSTMSGSGAAYTAKAMRVSKHTIAAAQIPTVDNWTFYDNMHNKLQTQAFLHEVSQGFALSINHGTHYPESTFRDCTPQQAYADFGIVPHEVGDVYLNVRSLPIRVGNNYDGGVMVGYSGDGMSDHKELTWEQVAANAEMPPEEARMLAERERTTVTKKIRRVWEPSWELLKFSAKFCGATKLILNFPQYIHWSAYKVRGSNEALKQLHPKVLRYIDRMEATTNLPVVMIGTGADHDDYIYLI